MAKKQSAKGFLWLNYTLAICLLASCVVVPPPAAQSPSTTLNTQAKAQEMSYAEQMRQKALVIAEKIKTKKPYNGPIGVHLNAGLLQPFSSQSAKVLDLTGQLNQDNALFQIQSLPPGPIVFQKTYEIGSHKLKELQTFRVPDTNQRYTLYLESPNALNGELEININGVDWIKAGDTKGQNHEVKREGLLLNSQNALRVMANGKKGTHFTVSIIEGGDAGTLLRRRHLGKEENQASRIRQNDTNIFNPFEPDSLGDLEAYNGEETLFEDFKITGLKVNGTDLLDFQSGTLILNFNQPEYKAAFEAEYGATVLAQNGDYYLMQLDLSKSPIEKIASLLKYYNMGLEEDIRDISFASLAGMQTFTILLDSLIYHMEWFKGIEVNGVMGNTQTPPVSTPTPVPTPNVCNGSHVSPVDWENFVCSIDPLTKKPQGPGKSWWLTDTKVAENPGGIAAWEYSIGTGVKAAFIDWGFKTDHAEVSRRIKVSSAYGNDDDINQTNSVKADHGHKAITTGFAEKGNKEKTAGSAPNAEIYPYRAPVDYWAFQTAIDKARFSGVNVIGISSAGKDFIWTNWITIPISILFGGLYHLAIPIFNWTGAGMMKAIDAAVEQRITVVTSAGNEGKNFKDFIPANHPQSITVGAIWPRSSRQIDPGTGLAIPGQEGLRVADFSNWGDGVIWAPGGKIDVSAPKATSPSSTIEYEGTSAASPFVTGIVALLKSRNPGLSPAQIKQILKETSLNGVSADRPNNLDTRFPKSEFPASMAPVRMLNAAAALQHPLVNTTSRKAETFFGLVENGKVLKLNKSVQAGSNPAPANEEKSKTLLETIGSEVWTTNLASGNLVQVKGWSDIKAGYRQIAKTEIEVMDGIKICLANNCSNPGSFKPQLSKVTYKANPVEANGFELELEGQNLVADIRTGTGIVPIKLVFKHVKSTATTPVTPLPGDKVVDISANQILDIRNDGTYIKLKANLGERSKDFEYQIAFRSGITGLGTFASNYVRAGGTTSAVFSIKAEGGSSNTFSPEAILSPPTGAEPAAFGVKAFYNPQNTHPISARAGDVIGFFTDNARTRNISIEIQGKNAIVTAAHDDLFTVTVPADLVVGLAHFTFKSDDTVFTIENLINYTSPFPEVVKWSKPTIFANGGDVVDAYITVKNPNGQPAPDGTPYYVQLVPTQLGLYPDLTMIHPETGQQYGGRWTTVEQVLPVKNGKIHIQAKLNAPIAPYEYTYDFNNNLPNVFTWPHANAPSFQVQVCNPAYDSGRPGYGYYCGQQLFPQTGNTLDGRLYALHAYSFDPQIHHVTGGSPKRTITIRNIKDILGNLVPVGTVLHFNQTYYGNVSNPNGNDIYWGVAVTTPGEVEIVYEPFQRFYCGSVGLEEVIYMTSVQGAANNSLYWLVGNPIYFRYVAC